MIYGKLLILCPPLGLFISDIEDQGKKTFGAEALHMVSKGILSDLDLKIMILIRHHVDVMCISSKGEWI